MWKNKFSLIFVVGTEQACKESLHDLNILCYLVILQAVLHLSESEEAEISYINMDW